MLTFKINAQANLCKVDQNYAVFVENIYPK